MVVMACLCLRETYAWARKRRPRAVTDLDSQVILMVFGRKLSKMAVIEVDS